jgi:FkbM family methyltransferase
MREVVGKLNDHTPKMRFVVHDANDEHVSESLATKGVWEPFESELVRRLIAAFAADGTVPIFVDCGANIGWYSVLAGVSGAKVVSFEPMPANATLLRENHDRNNFPHGAWIVASALGERPGQAELHLSETNQGDHRLHVGAVSDPTKQRQTVTVPVVRLGDFWNQSKLGRPHIIKIDTQGSEAAILRGSRNIWDPRQGLHDVAIITEFWPYGLTRCGSSADDFLKLVVPLIDKTHRCFEIQEWNSVLVPLSASDLVVRAGDRALSLEVRGFTNLALIPIVLLETNVNLLTDFPLKNPLL